MASHTSVMFSKFIYVAVQFILIAKKYSIEWTYHILCIHLLIHQLMNSWIISVLGCYE